MFSYKKVIVDYGDNLNKRAIVLALYINKQLMVGVCN